MNKKDLKMYEAPTVEILDIDSEGEILAGYSDDSNDGIGRPHIKYAPAGGDIEFEEE